jgi:hypothetical protein
MLAGLSCQPVQTPDVAVKTFSNPSKRYQLVRRKTITECLVLSAFAEDLISV